MHIENPHGTPIQTVFAGSGTPPRGLSSKEAGSRLSLIGINILEEERFKHLAESAVAVSIHKKHNINTSLILLSQGGGQGLCVAQTFPDTAGISGEIYSHGESREGHTGNRLVPVPESIDRQDHDKT